MKKIFICLGIFTTTLMWLSNVQASQGIQTISDGDCGLRPSTQCSGGQAICCKDKQGSTWYDKF